MSELTDAERCLKPGDWLVWEDAWGIHVSLARITRVSDASIWVGQSRYPRRGRDSSFSSVRIPTESDRLRLRVQGAQTKLASIKVDEANLLKVEALLEAFES